MSCNKVIRAALAKNPALTTDQLITLSGASKKTVWNIQSKIRKETDTPKKETATVFDQLRAVLKKNREYTIAEISDLLNIGVTSVRAGLEKLKAEGYNVHLKGDTAEISNVIPKSESKTIDIRKMTTGLHKFGAVGDNHMGSRYERMDVLNALYDEFEREGITTVFNTGNWIDGEARFNTHDLNVRGIGGQIAHFVKNYPQRKGITTYFIAGDDHEGWYVQREGIDIGQYAEMKARAAGRTDLVYLGYMEADVKIAAPNGETVIRVLHPGGGSSYAVSYSVQKIVESYQGGEKPHILLIGHYHKADYIYNRGVHCIQTGCTQDQSPFMRKKKLAAHVGGWIVEFGADDNGAITRFKQEFFPFYDNGYYQKWAYKWE